METTEWLIRATWSWRQNSVSAGLGCSLGCTLALSVTTAR